MKPYPCPFCDGKAAHTLGDNSIRQPDMVQCLSCGASIEEEYEPCAALIKWNSRFIKSCSTCTWWYTLTSECMNEDNKIDDLGDYRRCEANFICSNYTKEKL